MAQYKRDYLLVRPQLSFVSFLFFNAIAFTAFKMPGNCVRESVPHMSLCGHLYIT